QRRRPTALRMPDANRGGKEPQRAPHQTVASGLLAISVGLSRRYKNDQAQLAAGLDLYDTLYRWARDGHEEGHGHE
ncbi:MAG: chromate resistance protein ChrB domain-containing protein, partial [Pseudomonadota bacterium]